MGMVYKALHTKLRRVVALKVLPKDRMDDEKAVARFEREMAAVGRWTIRTSSAPSTPGSSRGHASW